MLGETILDEYILPTMAKSPKEEIISVQELNKEIYLSGILASASQICEFQNSHINYLVKINI